MDTQTVRFLAGGLLVAICSFPSKAEITLDGSLGPAGGAIPFDANNQFEIREDMGRTVGSNLFHSFGTFSIGAGETAAFTGTSPIENVLSRVTGGRASNIDGTLRTDFANATPNLFLLNPAGVVFGPNASLDVQGSFHVSTADYLRLEDGTRFTGIPSAADQILTTAPPEAFGFLGENPGSITFAGSGSELAQTNLGLSGIQVPEGETISIVGGDIEIKGGELSGELVESRLLAPSGRINIASIASAGELDLTDPDLAVSNSGLGGETRLGNVGISGGANVFTFGAMADGIYIRAGNFTLSGGPKKSTIFATPDASGKISLKASGTLTIDASDVFSSMIGNLDGGDIEIEARDLVVSNGANIGVFSESTDDADNSSVETGKTGDINISASNSILISTPEEALATPFAGPISSILVTTTDSLGGNISVSAPSLNVEGGSIGTGTTGRGKGGDVEIRSDQVNIIGGNVLNATGGSGDGGKLTILSNQLEIREGGVAGSGTLGPGKGGDTVVQTEDLTIDGFRRGTIDGNPQIIKSKITTSSNSSDKDATMVDSANAGDLTILADRLDIRNGGEIVAVTQGLGDGGNVEITANDVLLEGQIDEFSRSAIAVNAQGIVPGSGNAGDIVLNATNLRVADGAQIGATTLGPGLGGNLSINAERVVLQGEGGLFVNSQGTAPDSGNGGNLAVDATELELRDGGQISGATFGPGKGGDLTIRAEVITLDASEIRENNADDGAGNTITTSSQSLTKRKDSSDSANAGNIMVTTGRLIVRNGQIQTGTRGVGAGGDLSINADEVILEGNEAGFSFGLFASTAGTQLGSGDAGNLSLDTTHLILRNGAIIAAETFGSGRGGDISITAETISLEDQSNVSSVSGSDQDSAGISGSINVTAQDSLRLEDQSSIIVGTNQSDAGNINLNVGQLIHLGGRSVVSTSVADGGGNGGNINIDPKFVVLDDSRIIAEADKGNGGNIDLVADFFFQSPESIVDASSEAGIDGTVNIDSPDTNISGNIEVLPETYINAADRLSERCGARTANRNSFVIKGRGSVPLAPEDFAPATSLGDGHEGELSNNGTWVPNRNTQDGNPPGEKIDFFVEYESRPSLATLRFGCGQR